MRGVAAYSAAALATVALAAPAISNDECTDAECLTEAGTAGLVDGSAGLQVIRQVMEARGLPQETIDQTMASLEQPGDGTGDAGLLGRISLMLGADALSEDEREVLLEVYAELGIGSADLLGGDGIGSADLLGGDGDGSAETLGSADLLGGDSDGSADLLGADDSADSHRSADLLGSGIGSADLLGADDDPEQ